MSKTKTVNILKLVKILRSKNAGPLYFGFDIMFKEKKYYEIGKKYITKRMIANLYQIPVKQVIDVIPYDPGMGIKVVIQRPAVCGDHDDTDTYGCQQHVPLWGIELPLK